MAIKVEKRATLAGHRDCIYTLEPSGQSDIFFSAGGDGLVVMWDLKNPDIGTLLANVGASVYSLCYLPQDGQLVIGQNSEGIHIVEVDSKKEVKTLKIPASIFDIKFYDNLLYIATGDGYVLFIELPSLKILFRKKFSEKSARCIAINHACKEIAIGFSDNSIRVMDIRTGDLKYEFKAHENSVFTVTYSPDMKFLLSGSRDARLKKWDVFNGYSLDREIIAHMYAINHITFRRDGEYFYTCSMDKSIKVWNTEEMKLVKVIDRARHAGHSTSINKLLWPEFQDQLISCSDDKLISVWNIIIE